MKAKIEEILKELEDTAHKAGYEHYSLLPFVREDYARQIRRLFPKTEDNPDGYEPKPDESRLLTDEEIRQETGATHADFPSGLKICKAQLAKDLEWEAKAASIWNTEMIDNINRVNDFWKAECQARVERIFKNIEKKASIVGNGRVSILIEGRWVVQSGESIFFSGNRQDWQAFKKQEGVKE